MAEQKWHVEDDGESSWLQRDGDEDGEGMGPEDVAVYLNTLESRNEVLLKALREIRDEELRWWSVGPAHHPRTLEIANAALNQEQGAELQ